MSALLDRVRFEDRERSNVGVWSQEHPPCDSAAEAAVLNMLLIYPDSMSTLAIRDRLYLPEHRTIWRALSRVWMRDGLMEAGPWTLAIFRELHSMLNARHQGPCLPGKCLAWLHWDVLCHGQSASHRDLAYWLARLDRCVEARQIIEAAQDQAARAWRGDLDGARRAAAQVPMAQAIRIEV